MKYRQVSQTDERQPNNRHKKTKTGLTIDKQTLLTRQKYISFLCLAFVMYNMYLSLTSI